MGMCSRMRVLGYREVRMADGSWRVVLPRGRRPHSSRRIVMGKFTVRAGANVPAPDAQFAATDDRMAKQTPALLEFLTEQRLEGGQVRITSTLGISCEDGQWKVCLTDRAQPGGKHDHKLWKSGATLEEALRALDKDLQTGQAEWRRYPKWVAPKRS